MTITPVTNNLTKKKWKNIDRLITCNIWISIQKIGPPYWLVYILYLKYQSWLSGSESGSVLYLGSFQLICFIRLSACRRCRSPAMGMWYKGNNRLMVDKYYYSSSWYFYSSEERDSSQHCHSRLKFKKYQPTLSL